MIFGSEHFDGPALLGLEELKSFLEAESHDHFTYQFAADYRTMGYGEHEIKNIQRGESVWIEKQI